MNFEYLDDKMIYSLSKNDTFTKIASFDLDGTLIKTKSGKVFAKDKDDWQFLNDNVVKVLYKYYNEHYKIVIFTNQLGINKGHQSKDDFLYKIAQIHKQLKLDFDIFISLKDDYYRKPMTGMWDFFVENYSEKIDIKNSFYCGDNAGREKNWIKGFKKDKNSVDLQFAYNIGLKFEIPENIFSTKDTQYKYHSIDFNYLGLDLKSLLKNKKDKKYKFIPVKKDSQEVIIMVGYPASGKSELAKHIAKDNINYVIITDKEKNSIKKLLKDGKNVVVDGTHPSKKSRDELINIVEDYNKKYNKNVLIRIIHIDIPINLARHLNNYRVQISKGKIEKIPDVAYRVYDKKFDKLNENNVKIEKIEFMPLNIDNKMFLYHYT